MMIAVPLFLAAGADDVTATQRRVDELVVRCHAQDVIRLVAEDAQQVTMQPLVPPGEASAEQDRRFSCVLTGMKTMTDLSFGFFGNEVELNGS